MKQLIHKSIATCMACVVLLTTMSFTVDIHYCGNTLVDFSFVQQVETCGMETVASTSGCENPMLAATSCCTDQQVSKQGTEDLTITFDTLTFKQQVFVASFTYTYIRLFEGAQSEAIPFVAYAPPFVKQDVQVLHQTFLI
ncbi:HYC_CC_PP family protein [Rasiella sp. SM2506]|uniref:HYC_CC_PP family protein n=1 Tax=Rasiella sp. SM2506 TaxID=3423914 RepID=UPI003D7A693F